MNRTQEESLDKLWKKVWASGEKNTEEDARWRARYEKIQKKNRATGSRLRNKELRLMAECMNGNMEDFWEKVQAAMGRESQEEISVLRDEQGRLRETVTEKLEIMTEHYRAMGQGEGEVRIRSGGREEQMDETLDDLCNREFTREEWKLAKRRLKGKSTTMGEVTAKMVKCLPDGGEADSWGLQWANGVWEHEEWTEQEKLRHIVSIYKKGGREYIANYRGIVLVGVYSKILELMIDTRVKSVHPKPERIPVCI
jgi:hypothetical protein